MSVVSITNVTILNNPAKFLDDFQFEITFECIAPLKEGLSRFV
jgi:histone chaperone ASF1